MNENDKFALVPKTPITLERARPGANRILSGMVTDTLALVRKVQRSKPRIVLVNDDAEILQLIDSLICDEFTVLKFQSGGQAWQELQRQEPDLLITDMQRPDDSMDGWAMIPLLMNQKVKFPVVVVSGCCEFFVEKESEMPKSESVKFHSLLQHARKTINITAVAMPLDSEELFRVLKDRLEIKDRSIADTRALQKVKSSPKIVIVDDEPMLLELAETLIRKWFDNVTILTFEAGEEAWQELLHADPDLLITDMARGGLSGWEMLSLLAKRNINYPVFVTSGTATIEQVQQVAGLNPKIVFFEKPYSEKSFMEAIALVCGWDPFPNPNEL